MSRRPTFTDRRRSQNSLRIASLEAMEERNLITESLGIIAAGIGVPAGILALGDRAKAGERAAIPAPRAKTAALVGAPPTRIAGQLMRSASRDSVLPFAASAAPAARAGADWLAFFGKEPTPAGPRPSWSPAGPAKTSSSPLAQPAPRGSGGIATPAIAPLRLASPSVDSPETPPVFAPSGAAAVASTAGATPAKSAPTAARSSFGSPEGDDAPAVAQPTGPFMAGDFSPDIYDVQANSSPAAMGAFSNFPLYTLDYNNGTVFFPNTHQFATPGGNVDLRAQVRDTAVATYSWDTSHLTYGGSITGASTYRLQFQWNSFPLAAATGYVTLTVTDTLSRQEIQTYYFDVPAFAGGMGTGTATWPEALAPNTVLPGAPAFQSHNVSVDANSGSVDVGIQLPAYNPNIPGLALTYNSILADPRPIVVEHHPIDPALSIPTRVTGKLTFNGTAGTTYYYDTSQFIPGNIQQIALQANATALATGRYAYSVAVGDVRGSTTTTTVNGTATVLNGAANAFGAGWTLQGLQRITTATGGVILDLGEGGKSLWFSGSGPYTSPAGDFSTLATVGGGGYTRTMTDGTVYRFDSSGYQSSATDRTGRITTYAYSGGNLSTVKDPYGKLTTFAYSGGKLATITDPAARIATFTLTGTDLTGVTLPDGNAWSYGYDGSHRLTRVTDPRSKAVTVAYDAAQRASTITRPDLKTETFVAYQVKGWTNTGTSGSPAAATLLAEARASHTDPRGYATDLRPDWNGQGRVSVATDALGNVSVYDRDANGLATIAIDRLNRISRFVYDSGGNVTRMTYPDGNFEQYTYNSFAEPTTHTDPLNHTTTFTYDGSGNRTVVQDPLNNRTTMTYTGTGRVATAKDARNNITTYQYDSQDRLTTVTNPDTSTVLTSYDTKGNPTTVTDERNNSTTYTYDALNRVTGFKDALGNRTTFIYDASGNRTAVQAPLSRNTTIAYDSMNRATTLIDPLSNATVLGYDSGGNLMIVTDSLTRVTTYAYDAEGRRTGTTDPLGNRSTIAYDAVGQVLTVADQLSRVSTMTYNSRGWVATRNDPIGRVSTFTYTATGKTASWTDPASLGQVAVAYTYDSNDRLISTNLSNISITTYGYDAVGNRTTVTDGNNNTTTSAYDSRNRLATVTDPLSHATIYGYDSGGNRTTATDPLGHTTTTQYDALNRATTVTDARSAQTVLAFDAAGRNTVVVDPVGNRTTFAYDAGDRLTTMTDPLGNSVTYSYNADGELTDKTDRSGRRTTYSYDSGGRQTGETWVSASPANRVTYSYDAADQLTGVVDANARLTFTYDSGGRQLTASTSSTAGQPSVTLTSGYDQIGNRTSVTDNLSSVGRTTFSYDLANRLTTIARSLGGVAGPLVKYDYDAGNRVTTITRTIGGSGTQVRSLYGYDNANRMTTILHQQVSQIFFPPSIATTPLVTYAYGYDNADRLTSESIASPATSESVAYSYDDTNQLTGVSGSRSEGYSYDLNGNRNMTGYVTGTGNRLSESPGVTYAYDAEGNQTSRTDKSSGKVTTYSYDYRNRMTGATRRASSGGAVEMQATYTYDAQGRRIGTRVDADGSGAGAPVQSWMIYDGQNTYADFNSSGVLVQRYLYGAGLDIILARTDSVGSTAWYLTDRLGSVRDIYSSAASLLYHAAYDAYGNVISTNGLGGDRFKFTAREYDVETGLQSNRARYYNLISGRFNSLDPIGFRSKDVNLYRYVGNNVVNLNDPTGLSPWGDEQKPPKQTPGGKPPEKPSDPPELPPLPDFPAGPADKPMEQLPIPGQVGSGTGMGGSSKSMPPAIPLKISPMTPWGGLINAGRGAGNHPIFSPFPAPIMGAIGGYYSDLAQSGGWGLKITIPIPQSALPFIYEPSHNIGSQLGSVIGGAAGALAKENQVPKWWSLFLAELIGAAIDDIFPF